MNETRNKDVGEEDLNHLFEKIEGLEKSFLKEAKNYMDVQDSKGEKLLYTMDLYTSAIVNRSISLMRGYLLLAKDKNYISAVPLIRMQLDNCLRFYAATLVNDYNDLFSQYLKGKHIGNILDAKGNKMTDNYLAKELDKNFSKGIFKLYKNASGYVHFSNVHSFLQVSKVDSKKRTIGTQIGHIDFYEIDEKVDFTYNMWIVSKMLLKLVESWKIEKEKR